MKHRSLLVAASLIFLGSIVTSASVPQAQKTPVKLPPELLAKNVRLPAITSSAEEFRCGMAMPSG